MHRITVKERYDGKKPTFFSGATLWNACRYLRLTPRQYDSLCATKSLSLVGEHGHRTLTVVPARWWVCPECGERIDQNPVDPDGYFHCPNCGTQDPADIDLHRFEQEHREVEDYETGQVTLVHSPKEAIDG